MDRNVSSFTVCFQPPFWVGIAERWTADGYEAARVVFGPEPSDAQIYQWLGVEWHKLQQALAREREQAGERLRRERRQRRLQSEEERFRLRQQKKREKKRGR